MEDLQRSFFKLIVRTSGLTPQEGYARIGQAKVQVSMAIGSRLARRRKERPVDVVEKESTFGGQPSRRWQKVSRVLRSESINGRRGKGLALNRLSGGVGLKYNNGPKHNMGARRFTDHK